MKRSFAKRLFAMVLCLTMLMSLFMVPTANAATINKSTAAFSGTIMNNNLLFRSSSTIKITNTGSQGPLKVTISCSGCTVNKSSYTIPMGGSYTFTFTTPARAYSTVTINVQNTWGCAISYNMTCNNFCTVVRTK